MKKYTIEEIIFKIKELDKESEKMTETIRELRNKRSSLKIMDFAGKNAIDQEIDTKSNVNGTRVIFLSSFIEGVISVQLSTAI